MNVIPFVKRWFYLNLKLTVLHMKNRKRFPYMLIGLIPFASYCQNNKTVSSSNIYQQLPKRIVLSNQNNVCITDSQFTLVIIGLEQRELFHNQLQLSDDIINQKNLEITYLNDQIDNWKQESLVIDSMIEIEQELTRKEKRKNWWKDQKDRLIISGLSIIATIEGGFIIYTAVK